VNSGEWQPFSVRNQNPDSDNDGLADAEEVTLGTNPNHPDTDGDGLGDFAEVKTHRSNPLANDSDGDGYSDGVEVAKAGDPNNRNLIPSGAMTIFPAVDLEFDSIQGVKYQMEVTVDMIQWRPQGEPVTGNGAKHHQWVRATNATSFWRLKVVR